MKKANLLPLHIKLIFDIIVKWTSFDVPDLKFQSLLAADDCIQYLFDIMEFSHGKILFSRMMFYLTIFENGISPNEIEDLLSIDDDVLDEVYSRHQPNVRRFPFVLYLRIKNDLKEYLTERFVDDIVVISW